MTTSRMMMTPPAQAQMEVSPFYANRLRSGPTTDRAAPKCLAGTNRAAALDVHRRLHDGDGLPSRTNHRRQGTRQLCATGSENNITLGLTMLCVGLALGALTALLLAPKTGKQMRKTLRRKMKRRSRNHGRSAIRRAIGWTRVRIGPRRRSSAWPRLASLSADSA